MRFKQAVVEDPFKNRITAAAIRYKITRQNIYHRRKKYNRNIRSLADRSHRSHSHPNQRTETEVTLVKNMAPQESQRRSGGVLGQTLSSIHFRSIQAPVPY